MKTIQWTCSLVFWAVASGAQTLSSLNLVECYQLARQHYPMTRQQQLIEKSSAYSLSNVTKGYLPQVSVNGQATYQSDVISIPVSIPGLAFSPPAKDQYKLYSEVNQALTDLLTVKHQKELVQANNYLQEQTLDVELYKLNERVNQVFFGALLMDEQLKQATLLEKDLQANLDKVTTYFKNGTATKTTLDVLNAELLKTGQKLVELKSMRMAYLEMLGLLLGQPLGETTKLQMPESRRLGDQINRPELLIFEGQKKSLLVQDKLLTTRNLPKLGLFFQGGYARPAFNPFSNAFDFYYIGGLRLNWTLNGLYTLKKDRALLSLGREITELQRETFLFNTSFILKQQTAEAAKFAELLAMDQELVHLREGIAITANTQLENGTITASDYLRELNALDQARQNLSIHQVQLLLAQYTHLTTSGN